MGQTTPHRSIRHLRFGGAAAVIGTLATALTATPAQAAVADDAHLATAPIPVRAQGGAGAPSWHTVRAGDTVWDIAHRYGVRTADVIAWNHLGSAALIHPGQKLRLRGAAPASAPAPAAAPKAKTHTVVAGDTIFAIAQRNGSTVAAIFAANGLSGSSIIYPGQKIRIPLDTARAATLNSRQIENVRLIIRVGRELGVPQRGIAIALATSMVESGLRNLDHGDRDSVGLFQQRPSTGWGTAAQIQHRGDSIRAFFTGKGDATRGLLDVPGWESMRFTDAAQKVQISQYPERYGQWEKQAYRWLEQYG